MNVEVKHDSFVSSNILAVRAPNNGNDTIDNNNNNNNNNKNLPDKINTQCNSNTNSPDVNETSGLHRSARVRKPPFYMNYV